MATHRIHFTDEELVHVQTTLDEQINDLPPVPSSDRTMIEGTRAAIQRAFDRAAGHGRPVTPGTPRSTRT